MGHPESQQFPWTQIQKMAPCPFLEGHPTLLNSSSGSGWNWGEKVSRKWLVREAGSHRAPELKTQPFTCFQKAIWKTSLNVLSLLSTQGTSCTLLSCISGWKKIQQAIYHQIKVTAIKLILDPKERNKFDLTCRNVFWTMIKSLDQLLLAQLLCRLHLHGFQSWTGWVRAGRGNCSAMSWAGDGGAGTWKPHNVPHPRMLQSPQRHGSQACAGCFSSLIRR